MAHRLRARRFLMLLLAGAPLVAAGRAWAQTSSTTSAPPSVTTSVTTAAPTPVTTTPAAPVTTSAGTVTVPTTEAATTTTTVDLAGPATPDEGVGGMLQGPDLRGQNTPTLQERYPPGAYTWDSNYGIGDAGIVPVAALASFGLVVLVGGGLTVVTLMGWVFHLDALGGLGLDPLAHAIHDTLIGQLAVVAVVICGVAIAVSVLKDRSTKIAEHVAWAFGMLLILGLSGLSITASMRAVNGLTAEASRTMLQIPARLASYNTADGTSQTPTFNGATSDQALRRAADVWWRAYVYEPWCRGETGGLAVGGTALHLCEAILDLHSLTPFDPPELRALSPHDAALAKAVKFDTVRKQAADASPSFGSWLNGKKPGERLAIVAISGAVATISGLIILVICLAIIAWTIEADFRLLLLPAVAVAAIAPGKGRDQFIAWVQAIVASIVKRLGAALLLAVLLGLRQVMTVDMAARPWWVRSIVDIATSVVLVGVVVRNRHQIGAAAAWRPSTPGTAGKKGRDGKNPPTPPEARPRRQPIGSQTTLGPPIRRTPRPMPASRRPPPP